MWVLLVLATTGLLLVSQGSFSVGGTKIVADIPQYVCWLPAGAAGIKLIFDAFITKKVFKEYSEIKKKMF